MFTEYQNKRRLNLEEELLFKDLERSVREGIREFLDKIYREKTPQYKNQGYGKFDLEDVLRNADIKKVSQGVLGYGYGWRVLGRAFPYQNRIEILETLQGKEENETLIHEGLHLLFPWLSESGIRRMTRQLIENPSFN